MDHLNSVTTSQYIQSTSQSSYKLTEQWTERREFLPNETKPDIFNLKLLKMEFIELNVPCIIISPIIIIACIIICDFIYKVICHNLIYGIVRSCTLDLLAAGEATIISWELLTIFHQYGESLWAVGAFVTITVKLYRFKADSVACPYTHVLSVLTRVMSLRHAICRIFSQIVGGMISYRFLCNVWNLGLTQLHVSRSYWTSYGVCYSWLAVPTWQGVTFEFSGSLMCGVLTSLMFDYEIIKTMSIHSRILITSSITTILFWFLSIKLVASSSPSLHLFGHTVVLEQCRRSQLLIIWWFTGLEQHLVPFVLCSLTSFLGSLFWSWKNTLQVGRKAKTQLILFVRILC